MPMPARYSCAKRAIAALTWQLGRQAPPGVTVNAMSPIAATRMMASALERARKAGQSGGGGISFLSVARPEDLGPFGAYLVGEETGWCSGRVLFAGGPEVAVIDEPRLIEVVRTDQVASLARVLDDVVPRAFAKAEANQASAGGGNPRFGPIFDQPAEPGAEPAQVRSCVVVSDRKLLAGSLIAALEARSFRCQQVEPRPRLRRSGSCPARGGGSWSGPIDAVVVASSSGRPAVAAFDGWELVLADHRDILERIHTDAGWARAVADYAAGAARPVQLVTLTDATTSGGRSRAQAVGAARPGRRECHRGTGHGVRRQPRGSRGCCRWDRRPDWSPICSATPRHPRWPERSWWSAMDGSGFAAIPDRSAASPSVDRHFPTGSTGPSGRSWVHRPAGHGGRMTDRPTRVVDAHVHIWDPARTDWYPYLSHPQAPETADAARMFRRFDVDTYRMEAAGWNVEKFVNVAAATGRHSIEETLELDAEASARGGPDAIIGGIPRRTPWPSR